MATDEAFGTVRLIVALRECHGRLTWRGIAIGQRVADGAFAVSVDGGPAETSIAIDAANLGALTLALATTTLDAARSNVDLRVLFVTARR